MIDLAYIIELRKIFYDNILFYPMLFALLKITLLKPLPQFWYQFFATFFDYWRKSWKSDKRVSKTEIQMPGIKQ